MRAEGAGRRGEPAPRASWRRRRGEGGGGLEGGQPV